MTEARATGPHTSFARDAPLTVLFYSDAPYEGGAERYIDYLVDARPEGWPVGVVMRRDAALDDWARRLGEAGVKVFRTAPAAGWALCALWRATREMHPDVVHINMPYSYSAHYTAAAPVARLAGARAVVTTEHLTMFAPMRLRGRLRLLLTRAVDRVVTLSRSNRRDLVERHGLPDDKIAVVGNGVPDPGPLSPARIAACREALGVAAHEVMLLQVAALTERKGHAFLLDALERLDRREWRLVLLGEGEEEAALRRRVASMGLDGRVVFAGRSPEAVSFIQAADVVVLPSRVEGMPLVLLEALACGRPAIATDVFGVSEIYETGEAACLVRYGDVEALAGALERLIGDAALRERLGGEARRLFQARFSAREMCARTIDVYRQALGGAEP